MPSANRDTAHASPNKKGWHPDPNEGFDAILAEQAQELGVTQDDADRLQEDLRTHRTSYRELLGITPEEMASMVYRAQEHLRLNAPKQALSIFLALTKLSRFEAAYWRGAALCFQHMREWGFALGYYNMALATDADDRISALLRAECLLKLTGKSAAADALAQILARGPARNDEEGVYFARAQDLHRRLVAMGA